MADTPHPGRDERGTTLVLAIVFVFITATILVAVGGLAANALLNSSNVRVQRTTTEDAATAVTVAMQYVRYNPVLGPTQPPAAPVFPPSCLPPGSIIPSSDSPSASNPVQVYCTQQPVNMATPSPQTRVVDFYAVYCPSGTSTYQGTCTTANGTVVLHAEVTFDDLTIQGVDGCYVPPPPGVPVTTTCGVGMYLDTWDVIGADN